MGAAFEANKIVLNTRSNKNYEQNTRTYAEYMAQKDGEERQRRERRGEGIQRKKQGSQQTGGRPQFYNSKTGKGQAPKGVQAPVNKSGQAQEPARAQTGVQDPPQQMPEK